MTTSDYRSVLGRYLEELGGQFALTLRLPEADTVEQMKYLIARDLLRPLKRIYRGNVMVRGVVSITDRRGNRCPHAHLTVQVPVSHPIQNPDKLLDEIRGRSRSNSTVIKANGLMLKQIDDLEGWARYMAFHLSPDNDRSELFSEGKPLPDIRPYRQ